MVRLLGLLLQGLGGIILLGLFALNFVAGAQAFGLQFLPELFSEPPWAFLIADLSAPLFFYRLLWCRLS